MKLILKVIVKLNLIKYAYYFNGNNELNDLVIFVILTHP